VCFRCIEALVKAAHVLSQVSLPGDCPGICCKFLKYRSFSTYAMEIKKLFGAGVTIPEPTCCRELVVSRNRLAGCLLGYLVMPIKCF
jgi:hypothetical protein